VDRIGVRPHRQRYIAFTIQNKQKQTFTRQEIIQAIKLHCTHTYKTHPQTYGFFLTRLKENKGIFRCYHTEKERAITFLTSITTIDGCPVTITTLGTSGTMKALIRNFFDGDPLKEVKEPLKQ